MWKARRRATAIRLSYLTEAVAPEKDVPDWDDVRRAAERMRVRQGFPLDEGALCFDLFSWKGRVRRTPVIESLALNEIAGNTIALIRMDAWRCSM